MADNLNTAQSQQIDTSQPTPLRGLRLRGVKETPEILCVKKGAGGNGEDLFYKVAAANFDPKEHTKAEEDKLPTRKKKVSRKASEPAADDGDNKAEVATDE